MKAKSFFTGVVLVVFFSLDVIVQAQVRNPDWLNKLVEWNEQTHSGKLEPVVKQMPGNVVYARIKGDDRIIVALAYTSASRPFYYASGKLEGGKIVSVFLLWGYSKTHIFFSGYHAWLVFGEPYPNVSGNTPPPRPDQFGYFTSCMSDGGGELPCMIIEEKMQKSPNGAVIEWALLDAKTRIGAVLMGGDLDPVDIKACEGFVGNLPRQWESPAPPAIRWRR